MTPNKSSLDDDCWVRQNFYEQNFKIPHPTSYCDSWNNSCNFLNNYWSYTITNYKFFGGHPVVLAWVRFCMCPPFLLWIVNEIITSMTTETSKSDKPQKEEVNLLNYIITLLFHLNITDIVLAVAAALPSQVTSRCGWWVAMS